MTRLLGARRWRFVVMLVINGLLQAGGAIVVGLAVDSAFDLLHRSQRPSTHEIVSIGVILLLLTAARGWLRARERVDAERLGQSYVHDLRIELFGHLTEMSARAVSSRSTGGTAVRFVGDASAVRKWISLGVARLCVATTMLTATLTILWIMDPLLAIAIGGAALIGSLGALTAGTSLREAERLARKERVALAGRITEMVGAIGVVQANGAVARERGRLENRSRRLRNAMIARARLLGRLTATAEATAGLATATLIVVGMASGRDSAEIAAGMTIVGLLVPQLRGLARVQEYRQGAQVSLAAIERFRVRPTLLTEPVWTNPMPDGPGRLDLTGVGLGVALDDITVSIPGGCTVAIVGPNGAGKSTLFSVLARLVDADRGTINLDGSDMSKLALADVRHVLGLAGPDFPLLSGSVRRNLSYRLGKASDEELEDLIDRCDLRTVLSSLPKGLETRIYEGGTNLSAGQRQRVQLARAILGNPRLLLLDEADANLDARTHKVVDRLITERSGTTLVITHDHRRVAFSDLIIHLDHGTLVEIGTPAELLYRPGPTQQLFESTMTPTNSSI